MRLVIDTDVVVAAMRSRAGASAALLSYIADGAVTMLVSVPLVLEYEAKCVLPIHRDAAGFSQEEASRFVDLLVRMAEPVPIHFLWRPMLHDPGDEMVLDVAVNGRADAIVTFNRRDYGAAPARFGMDVLAPGEVLRRLRNEVK